MSHDAARSTSHGSVQPAVESGDGEGTIPSLDAVLGLEGTAFGLEGPSGPDLVLGEVDTSFDTRADRERFSLLFDGPAEPALDQGTYRLLHDDLGAFDLVLVPVAVDGDDRSGHTYEAIVDRVVPGRTPLEGLESSRRGLLASVLGVALGGSLLSLVGSRRASAASSDPFIGSVSMFAGNFAPRGWALCDGQLLPISSNAALFSLLGTTYGGDGRTTFALPDLRGRVPMHPGTGPGLTPRRLGDSGGSESVALSVAELPRHDHPTTGGASGHDLHLPVTSAAGDATTPGGNLLAAQASPSSGRGRGQGRDAPIYGTGAPDGEMAIAGDVTGSFSVGETGGGLAHDNLQPYLGVNFIIALVGLFPSRN